MAYTATEQPQKNGFFTNMANPVIRKLERKGEFSSDNTATYGGIIGKTVFFLLVTVIGVFLCFILHNILMNSTTGEIFHVQDEKGIFDLTFNLIEGIIMFVVLAISLITPFLAFFIRSSIPVTGTLYSLCQGLLIGYITVALVPQYRYISLLAMIITLSLVAVMLFIYAKRIIKVTARFRGIVFGMFAGIVLSGIIYFLLNLIPGVRNSGLFSGINQALQNPVISIGISVIFVILAALFMLADFDAIERCVSNRLDKKYEWMAAWGLAYTILYIYFKILRILLTILGSGRKSSK